MSTPSPVVVGDRYEAARAWATGTAPGVGRPARGTAPGVGRPPGLALVLRCGLPAWLAAWETGLPAQTSADAPSDVDPPPTRPDTHALAIILATMVEHCRRDRRDGEEH